MSEDSEGVKRARLCRGLGHTADRIMASGGQRGNFEIVLGGGPRERASDPQGGIEPHACHFSSEMHFSPKCAQPSIDARGRSHHMRASERQRSLDDVARRSLATLADAMTTRRQYKVQLLQQCLQ